MDFNKAFEKILKDDRMGGNPVPDPLRFSYFVVEKGIIFDELKEKVIDQSYIPSPLLEIDVPKPNFTIRPMARPEIHDWVIYQSIIDTISEKIAPKLSKRSYSLLKFGKDAPKRKTGAWINFDDQSRKFYSKGYNCVVVTDISSYFENINLQELLKKIVNYINRDDKDLTKLVNFLFTKFLNKWSSGRVRKFGLPQGPAASLFLGDLYLDNVDGEMEEEEGYLRYMDDIRIFCKTETAAKKVLIKLIKCLRKYKLNINAKKTKILLGKEIPSTLFDSKKPLLDAIQKAFDSRDKSKIIAVTSILVEDIFIGGFDDENIFGDRHIRFSLPKLESLKNSGFNFSDKEVLALIKKNFIKMPQHAGLFCRYLSAYPNKPSIQKFFYEFLISEDNIYDWQEMYVLRSLLEVNVKKKVKIVKLARVKFKDKNIHWANRALFSLLIGKCGTVRDRELVVDEFNFAEGDEFRKSLVLAVQELGDASRNDFYNKAQKRITSKSFVNYIKGFKVPMYFRPYDRIKLENLRENEVLEYPY